MASTSQVGNKNGELPEFPIRGPFGGIQSELPVEAIEPYGFADALNVVFRLGAMRVRPKFYTDNAVIPAMPAPLEPILGIKDFYNANGEQLQVMLTPTRMFKYDNSTPPAVWTPLTGTLTGGLFDKFDFGVVAEQLCFCQGVDKVQLWDGIGSTFGDASADAVPAKYMCELVNHLIVANTIESGSPAYQRWRYTAAGDPTDWVGFNAGQEDLFNDLGPINRVIKLYQSGYFFQQFGIVQIIPTGIGTAPFAVNPLSARSKGLICPWGLATNGETTATYPGKDNIYSFDGNTSTPVGDYPMDGRKRGGARTRIFQDLLQSDLNKVFGFVSTSINGHNYNAYWLCIPNIACWVLNYDDLTWTRWSVDGYINYVNLWTPPKEITWMDLIGTWAQQLWTWDNPINRSPFDSVMIGFADGSSALFDFTGYSEKAGYLQTGQMSYGDDRHGSATKKLRMVYKNLGVATAQIKLENEDGQVSLNNAAEPLGITFGDASASGKSLNKVIPVNLPGDYATLTVSFEAETPLELHTIAPQYSESGEVK